MPAKYKQICADPRADAIRFWNDQVANPANDIRARMYAQEQLDKRFGVDRPADEPSLAQAIAAGTGGGVIEILVSTRAEAKQIIDISKSGGIDIDKLKQLGEVTATPAPAAIISANPPGEVLPAEEQGIDSSREVTEIVVTRDDVCNGRHLPPADDLDSVPRIVPD